MDDSLRGYNRRLLRNLMAKERQLSNLKDEFLKLRRDYFHLQKAFKSNFELHEELLLEVNRMRAESDERRRAENDCSNEFLRLNEQLRRIRSEKEIAEEETSWWKKRSASQKEYYESRYEETLKIGESRLKADRMEFEKEVEEIREAARKYVAELTSRSESSEKKVEAIERRLIALQADLDVRTYRRDELIRKLVSFREVGARSETVCGTIARALQSLDSSQKDHEQRMTELEGEMARQASLSPVKSSDCEKLARQNRVLREVVKKLKRGSEDRKTDADAENETSDASERKFNSTSEAVEIFLEMEEAAKLLRAIEDLSAKPRGSDPSLSVSLRLKKSANLHASRSEVVNRVSPGKFAQDERRSNNYSESVKPPSSNDNDAPEARPSSWNKRVARFNEQTMWVRLKFEDADLPSNESPLYSKVNDEYSRGADFPASSKTKINHRGVQTLPAAVKTVSTQTTDSAVTARKSFAGTKMTNCEKRAIERGLRALERTVDEARCEILEEARLFGRRKKHLDGKKFHDCVEYQGF